MIMKASIGRPSRAGIDGRSAAHRPDDESDELLERAKALGVAGGHHLDPPAEAASRPLDRLELDDEGALGRFLAGSLAREI
jgi:hypothetical protein